MLPPVLLLPIHVLHSRGGERNVAVLATDRVVDVIARALAEAGIPPDAYVTWELCQLGQVLPGERLMLGLLPGPGETYYFTLRPAAPNADTGTFPIVPQTRGGRPPATDFTDILLKKKLIAPDQLADCKRTAAATGMTLQDALTRQNYVTPAQVMSAVAEQHGLEFVDLTTLVIPQAVIELVPESVARENLVLPLSLVGNTLRLAVADPTDYETVQTLQFILNKTIVLVLTTREQIQEAINRHYGQTETESVDSMLAEFTDTAIDFTRTDSIIGSRRREEAPPGAPGAAAPADSDDEDEVDDEFDDDSDDADSGVGLAGDSGAIEPATGTLEPSPPPAPEMPTRSRAAAPPASGEPTDWRMKRATRSESRRATVRYYSRMNPDRVFPLLVMLTRQEVEKVVKRHVEQKATGPITIAKDVPLEIEPVLPGCVCHPPKVVTRLGGADDVFTFHVVPHVLGEVTGARVLIRQDHALLAEVQLDIRVVQRTWVMVSGLSTVLLPTASAIMENFGVDFTPKDGSNPYLAAMKFLFGQVSPGLLMAALAAVTGVAWWATRPKGRDVFWDISTKPPGQSR